MARLSRIKTNGELQVLEMSNLSAVRSGLRFSERLHCKCGGGRRDVSLEANSSFSGSSSYIPVSYRGLSLTRVPRRRKYCFVSCVKG